ncbi:MAG: hypothetical protein JW820_15595 [Spirochaetales bacterium]|nr:hypothetical protein [Spirochaetales bacterium]
MRRMNGGCLVLLAGLVCLFSALAAPAAFAQTMVHSGALGPGDARLGKYFDTYPLQLSVGDRLVATLSSEEFDAYLLIESPDGRELENDDYQDGSDARLDVLVETRGEWRIKVTSYEEGEEGQYRLVINRERLQLLETHEGTLEAGDPVSIKGEHYDTYTLRVQADQRLLVSLRSDEFDSYLALKLPQGTIETNDDYLAETESRIDTIVDGSGVCQLYATSFQGGETGGYALKVFVGGRAAVRELSGFLDAADEELEEYGYFEEHPLYLEAGEHIVVEMSSEELDTVLIVTGPGGFYQLNDDYNDLTTRSRLDLFAEQAGDYRILAGSFEAGFEGAYALKIYSFGAAGSYGHAVQQLASR